ncbi:MAG TPA: MFS transporter [Mycobacteriales bacterium]
MTRPGDRPATYREVLAVREFAALYAAQITSLLGDQVARVALSLLVLNRSDNPLLAALAFASTYLPWIIGGPILSPLADRRPRRAVMVSCDVVRAVAVGAMALPGVPLWLLFGLLFGASLLMAPFEAARAATLPDVLTGDRYVVGSALANITTQFGQVAGLVLGGALVGVLTPRGALAVDAATFAISATFIATGVRHRPAASRHAAPTLRADIVDGARVVFRSSVLRSILLLAWAGATFAMVQEGLAPTYARRLGYGPLATGWLVAASPLGFVVGALVLGRMMPSARLRLMLPLAAASFVPLVVTAVHPPLWGAIALWAASGAGLAYQIPANATFMVAVPPEARGRAFGLAQTGIQALQGLSIAGGGGLALLLEPHQVIAIAGIGGLVSVGLIAALWPARQIDAVYAVPGEDDLGVLGDVPIESSAPLPELRTWSGPYPLTPRRRVLIARLFHHDVPAATRDSSTRS